MKRLEIPLRSRAALLISLVALFVVTLVSCANRAVLYTEGGLTAGAAGWDGAYRAKAAECKELHEPQTPAMEGCFGAHFEADAEVALVIQSAVALLRTYWTARAAGEQPDAAKLARQLAEILTDLPPEAGPYFERVKGFGS